jgi:hypothetical protein
MQEIKQLTTGDGRLATDDWQLTTDRLGASKDL